MLEIERIELNLPGLNKLMKSAEIKQSLEKAADAVADKAEKDSGQTYKRRQTRDLNWLAMVNVSPSGADAENDELENNRILKAVKAVGLSTRKGGSI